jgi:hypothetical protein
MSETPTPPPTPPPLPPIAAPPRRWSAGEYALGFVAPMVAVMLFAIPLAGIMIAPLLLLATFIGGLVWALTHKRWSFFLGATTCGIVATLTLFVFCVFNPPNFH